MIRITYKSGEVRNYDYITKHSAGIMTFDRDRVVIDYSNDNCKIYGTITFIDVTALYKVVE